jgi:hypothetical protein
MKIRQITEWVVKYLIFDPSSGRTNIAVKGKIVNIYSFSRSLKYLEYFSGFIL